jgi:putative LysE/RhtB family amino acid efflux pump
MYAALVTGLGLGLLVAAQVGPLWLLCARSSLRHGFAVGLAIGAGVAVIDFAYATLGAAGAARVLDIPMLRPVLGLVGGGVLIWLGSRTLWSALRVRHGAEADSEVASPRAAFVTALGATASNPATIASWAAVFAAASVGSVTTTLGTTALFIAAIGVGSFAWHVALSAGFAIAGRRTGPRTERAVDVAAGAGLIGFGGLLTWRALRSS